ncbi:MAG: riboflavin synthase [Bryobacteraceae bacterium]
MFTGIVEELGTIAAYEAHAAGAKITVRCEKILSDLTIGASIAVNGACLTATIIGEDFFSADLAPETLSRTNLGSLATGSRVNLERPVTPMTRLSGHIVQGHVDGTGELLAIDALGDGNWWIKVVVPQSLDRYMVEKGSVTLDGISLTIAKLDPLGVTIIPHTFANTTLGHTKPGAKINIEVDVLAKHVEKLLTHK